MTDMESEHQVKEQLHDVMSRIEAIEQERVDQETRSARTFELSGTPPVSHTEDEFQSLINKMKAKHPEPSLKSLRNVEGAHRAPRADAGRGNVYRAALKSAGYELRDANKLLILEAWDIIHRGSYGYPGWYDPNNGLYVDPETFYWEDRKEIVRGISDEDLASPAVAHDVIRRMVAGLQDPYSRLSEPSEAFINADDHAKQPERGETRGEGGRGGGMQGSGRREETQSGGSGSGGGGGRIVEQAPEGGLAERRGKEALEDSLEKRLVGVGLQLADPLDGREDLVVVAPIPNSPAEAAGIQPLDRLLQIDDMDVSKYRLTTGIESRGERLRCM
jgi:hypothetical protein